MMYILLVDDEPLARSRLRRLLTEMEGCEVVAEAADGKAALAACRQYRPDVILLDIHMPEMDGLRVATELKDEDPQPVIIFCTAYDAHALQAFEAQALDYLLKPIRRDRLQAALEKARRFLGISEEDSAPQFIRSHFGEKVILIPLADIYLARAEDKYTILCHREGEAVIDESLKSLEQSFGSAFFRVHRNTLVTRDKIRGIRRDNQGQQYVLLEGTDETPQISRRNVAGIREWLKSRAGQGGESS